MLIGTFLKQNGYNVHIIDGAYHEDYKEKIKTDLHEMEWQILFVGMSFMVTQIPFALEAAKIVKGINADMPVVW